MNCLRVGRKVGRTLYYQFGVEPSDRDPLVGVMDTRQLAEQVVRGWSLLEHYDTCASKVGDECDCPLSFWSMWDRGIQ